MKTSIRPRGKYILVQPDPEKSRVSAHGLVTPSNIEQEKKSVGTVIAVGPEIKDVKKGNHVIYGTYAGERIKQNEGIKEVEYVLLHDDDVLAFLE
mgnify:CR=1 FL=1